jgi:hypothetical protein
MKYAIEIDCPPGSPRPGDLLPGVLKDTGVSIDPNNTVSRLFGNWEWAVPENQERAYERARPTIQQRLTALYHAGVIRYAAW